MYVSSLILYLFISGLVLWHGGTTNANPLQSTGTQLLTLPAYGSETRSNIFGSLANVSSLSLNVSSQNDFKIQCERYKYGFLDDEVLLDCGRGLPYMVGSYDIEFVGEREMEGNVVCLPYRQYGSEYYLGSRCLIHGCKAALAEIET